MFRFHTFLLLILLSSSACTEYWWSRGQPPSPKERFSRQETNLAAALEESKSSKPELANSAARISALLSEIVNRQEKRQTETYTLLDALAVDFMKLEGKLSYTSRPAYGELSSQIRAFQSNLREGGGFADNAFKLFAARACSFLASELRISV